MASIRNAAARPYRTDSGGQFQCFSVLVVVLASLLALNASRADELPRATLTVGAHKLVAEVAADEGARTVGLMNRFSLAPDHGMLFVFPAPQPLSFWMKNTYVALSVAFIDANGKILNIEDMAPLTEATHLSKGQAQFALEMKRGWFSEHGIRAGATVAGLDKVAKAAN